MSSEREQKLHVARHVFLIWGFLHAFLFLLALLPSSQEQESPLLPFPIMNLPWESEQRYSEHMPQTLGQCEAIAPSLEHHACTFLLSNIHLHLKGMPLPAAVSSRRISGESMQGDLLLNAGLAFDSSNIIILPVSLGSAGLRLSLLAIETPSSEVDA